MRVQGLGVLGLKGLGFEGLGFSGSTSLGCRQHSVSLTPLTMVSGLFAVLSGFCGLPAQTSTEIWREF